MAGPVRTIVCFGDSNTHGTLPMLDLDRQVRLGPDERWPGVAAAGLGAGWRVVEEGLPGRTSVHDDPISGSHKNGRTALPIILESHAPIDVLVIMLGTNDMKARFSVVPEDIADSLDRLAQMAVASGAGPGGAPPRILLVGPPPILEVGCLAAMFTGGAAKSLRLGALVGEMARKRGYGFIDAGSLIRSSPVDGVHFEPSEHATLGRAIAQAVRDVIAAV